MWGEADGFRRFDASLRSWTKPNPGVASLARGDGGEEWVLLYDGVDTIDVFAWPALGAPVASIDAGSQMLHRLAAGPRAGGGTRIWIATAAGAGGTDLGIVDLSADGSTVTPVRTVSVPLDEPRVLYPDPTGAAAAIGGEDYLAVVPAVTPVDPWELTLPPGTVIEGGGARPDSVQMWFSASRPGGAFIYALDLVPGSAPANFAEQYAPRAWRDMAWFDGVHFWAATLDAGLILYEPDHYTELERFDDVTEIAGDLHVDPGTGACHFTTASALVTAHTDGREERTPVTATLANVAFVAADGSVAIEDTGTEVRIGRTILPDALEATADLALAGGRRVPGSGAVWGVASGGAIARVATDGRTDRLVSRLAVLDVGGVDLAEPSIAIDPDEQGGWVLENGVLYRLYEIWVDPLFPEYEEAFVVAETSPAGYVPIASSSPEASPRRYWASGAEDGTGTPFLARLTVDTSGTFVRDEWPYDVPAGLVLLP